MIEQLKILISISILCYTLMIMLEITTLKQANWLSGPRLIFSIIVGLAIKQLFM